MKVLLISSSSGSHGGGEFYLKFLADGLVSEGCEVNALMSDGSHMDGLADMMKDNCTVTRIPLVNTYQRKLRTIGSVLDKKQIQRVRQAIDLISPDVVHLNKQCIDDGLGILAALCQLELPSVTMIHVPQSMAALKARMGKLRDSISRKWIQRSRSLLITASTTCKNQLENFAGPSQQVVEISNGVTAASTDGRAANRKDWGFKESEFVMGTVARIEEQKNPLFMPQIVANLPSHVHMIWIGDGRMREDLEAEIERHNVADRFHLLGWKENAKNLLCGMDVFVLPSIYEGFPFAILEAMSVGLPCVVSDVDGNGESVVDGTTGDVLPVNDVGQWTRSLERLVLQDGLRKEYGEAALARFSAEYDVSIMAKRTVAVYEKAIQQHKQRGQTTL